MLTLEQMMDARFEYDRRMGREPWRDMRNRLLGRRRPPAVPPFEEVEREAHFAALAPLPEDEDA